MPKKPLSKPMYNAYLGTNVDEAKVEEQAQKRLKYGESTVIHYHSYIDSCHHREHKLVSPTEEKSDD